MLPMMNFMPNCRFFKTGQRGGGRAKNKPGRQSFEQMLGKKISHHHQEHR